MKIGVPKETSPGEQRVALVPSVIGRLAKAGLEVVVEAGAGLAAGFEDDAYTAKGAQIASSRDEVFTSCDLIGQVRALGANPEHGHADIQRLREGQVVVATTEPLQPSDLTMSAASSGAVVFALELVPRITRAQSMDVLSSMATIAGYKAVLLGAAALNRMFPMLMTAAGTISPAKVLVLGAGVAGLQAIATARRLGAVVSAYDIRPAVREQVESLGAKFVELDLEVAAAQDKGGYAKEMGEDFLRRQREQLTAVAAQNDVLVTTAAVPGKKAPVLVPSSMVEALAPGSVVVDLAAERGGNCELTKPGETVVEHGVTIIGPLNLPTTVPYHASEMFARNLTAFVLNMVEDGAPALDKDDEILSGTMVTRGGDVVHPRVREVMGLPAEAVSGGGES